MELTSQVIISAQIEKTIAALEDLRQNETLIEFISPSMHKVLTPEEGVAIPAGVQRVVTEKETFRVEDAKRYLTKPIWQVKRKISLFLQQMLLLL